MSDVNYYIKYKLNDRESFNKAINKAKELWYAIWDYHDSLIWWNVKWILALTIDKWVKEFFVPFETEKELIKMWYKELII